MYFKKFKGNLLNAMTRMLSFCSLVLILNAYLDKLSCHVTKKLEEIILWKLRLLITGVLVKEELLVEVQAMRGVLNANLCMRRKDCLVARERKRSKRKQFCPRFRLIKGVICLKKLKIEKTFLKV